MEHCKYNKDGCIYTVCISPVKFCVLHLLRNLSCLDDRNIPALGRIGDPDDIIASVLVEDGKVGISIDILHLISPPHRFKPTHIRLCPHIVFALPMV